jgi:hypothetical protein
MSVQKRGRKWQCKWREAGGQRSRSFDRKGDADRFDLEIRRRLQLGALASDELIRTAPTLEAFALGGFQAHAATLAPATRAQYVWALNHLQELLTVPLDRITVPRLAGVQQHLLDRGATPHTVKTVMTMLSGILQIAVEHGVIPANPVRSLRKPPVVRGEKVPLAPVELEALILTLEGRERAICLLGGHLGLRPLELRQVLWGDLRGDVLVVSAARTKKTAARTRSIKVPAATLAELKRWRLESGRPADSEPIIGPMTTYNLKRIGAKLGRAARDLIGRDDVTLYSAAPHPRVRAALRGVHRPGRRPPTGARPGAARHHLRARDRRARRSAALRRPRRPDRRGSG